MSRAFASHVHVLDDQPEAATVREFIASDRWRPPPPDTRLATRNPRYEIHVLALEEPGGTPCILKIARAAPAAYRWSRRLNVLVSHWLRDPSRRALRGARLLAERGIPTLRPLACWKARGAGFWSDSYLLYARIPACGSVRDVQLDRAGIPPAEKDRALAQLTDRIADLVAALHRSGLRHDDLACGNFLIGDDGRLHLIDVDHVRAVRWRRFPRLKRFFDLGDLRRLNLDESLRRAFLRRYLGDADSAFWWRVQQFWRDGGNRPFRWLLRRLGLRRPSARADAAQICPNKTT